MKHLNRVNLSVRMPSSLAVLNVCVCVCVCVCACLISASLIVVSAWPTAYLSE